MNVQTIGIPFLATATSRMPADLPRIHSVLRLHTKADKPRIVLYGMGPAGQALSLLLRASGQTEVVGLIDRSVDLTVDGLVVTPVASLKDLPPFDLVLVTTNPAYHDEIIEALAGQGIADTPVLLLFTGQTAAAASYLLESGDPYSANLALRNLLQQHPEDPELLALSERMRVAYEHDPEIRSRLAGEVPGPHLTNVQIIDACGLRCVMCFRQDASYASAKHFSRPMSLSMFRGFLDACEGSPVATMYLGGSGEAFLHPQVVDLLDLVLGRGIRAHIITSGSHLTPSLIEQLTERDGFDLEFSVDAYETDTYESIRVGANRDKVFRNLETFAGSAKAKGRDITLALTAVLMRRNVQEFPRLLEFAARVGIPRVTALHVLVTGGLSSDPEESLVFHPELYNAVLAESHELAGRLGISLTAPPRFQLDEPAAAPVGGPGSARPWQMCVIPWTRLDMLGIGYAVCCGGHPELPFTQAFMDHPEQGPWTFEAMTGHATLHDLFNCETMRILRDQLLRNQPSSHCRNCYLSAYNSRDVLFSSAISRTGIHDEELYIQALNRFQAKFAGTPYLRRMLGLRQPSQ